MASKSEAMQKLVAKAASDKDFRAQLSKDPQAAIKSMGMTTRPGLEIEVLEETAAKGYIVLPFNTTPGADGDLSDDALDAVSGGSGANCPLCGAG